MSVPQLRFDGFDGEWKRTTVLNELSIIDGDRGKNYPNDNDYLEEGYCLFLNTKNVTKKGFNFKLKNFIDEEKHLKMSKGLLQRGDIVMTSRGSIGNIALYTREVPYDVIRINSAMLIVRLKNELIDTIFLEQLLKSKLISDFVRKSSVGSAQPHITVKDFNKMKMSLPCDIEEQKKVGSFLKLLSQKIEKQKEKMEKLEQFKKGMMQKIFSQELRFKDEDGEGFPKWEVLDLKGIVDFCRNGISLTQSSQENGVKVTRIETISDGKINLSKVGYVSTDKDISDYKLKVNDILFSNINSVAHIGKVAIVKEDNDLYHGMNLLCIRTNEFNDGYFLYNLLSQEKFKSYFQKICNKAVNQASINQTELLKTEISRPVFKEQKKIAKFFSILDTKIEKEKEKLMVLEEQKKGFMQGMFV